MFKILGYGLLVLPFIVITGVMVKHIGIRGALFVWGCVAVLLVMVVTGVWLISV